MRLNGNELIGPGAGNGAAAADSGLARIENILNAVKDLMTQYNAMRGGQAPTGPAGPAGPAPRAVIRNDEPAPGSAPAGPAPGSRQMVKFADQFLGSLEDNGKGDAPIGSVIAQLPFTVKQVRQIVRTLGALK